MLLYCIYSIVFDILNVFLENITGMECRLIDETNSPATRKL